MKLGIFGRGKSEEAAPLSQIDIASGILDRLCAGDSRLREEFHEYVSLGYGGLRSYYGPHEQAIGRAEAFEREGTMERAASMYHVAGVLGLYEGKADGAKKAFEKWGNLKGKDVSRILEVPEQAARVAKALYEEMKPKQAEARPEIKKPEVEATPQVGK